MNETGKQIECIFDGISERDMDMLFLEEFVASEEFLKIFTSKINVIDAKVLSVQASKTDIELGESDMTVIIESNSKRIGLLIEDKIDAIAMPDQAQRYVLRGKKGKQQKEYNEFHVFIVAPEKYLSSNMEASKYPNQISYETILDYFENRDDNRSLFKIQQIKLAIEQQKTGYQPIEDKRVTEFWNRYSKYQKQNYPSLNLLYNNEIKGTRAWWPRFNTVTNKLYIVHKSNFGYIDLTFDGCAERILEIEELLTNTIGDYLSEGYTVNIIGKSAAIRLNVPVIDFHQPFDEQFQEIKDCFEAIYKMNNLAKKLDINQIRSICI